MIFVFFLLIDVRIFCVRNLEDYLAGRNDANMEKSTRMFTEIMTGVHSMHQSGIIHRDIKPMNILVDSNEHVSITDFGMGKVLFVLVAWLGYACELIFSFQLG